MDMYFVTRGGEPIAGSLPVPFEAAVTAAMLLNREYRRRDLFDWAPAPDELVGELSMAPAMRAFGAVVSSLVREVGDGFLSGPRAWASSGDGKLAATC